MANPGAVNCAGPLARSSVGENDNIRMGFVIVVDVVAFSGKSASIKNLEGSE